MIFQEGGDAGPVLALEDLPPRAQTAMGGVRSPLRSRGGHATL